MTAFRKLLPTDLPQFVAHLLALDLNDRRRRFQGFVCDDSVVEHGRHIDWFRTVLIGHFTSGRLTGVAELVFDRTWQPHSAEAAVTVEQALQGQGIGTELTRRAAIVARNRGAEEMTMLCLTENRPMQRIARRLTRELHFEGGSIEAKLPLARANPLSFWLEAMQDGSGALMSLGDGLLAA